MAEQDNSHPGSIAADTDRSGNARRPIAPTTHDTWRNTLGPILKPVACWRIHHAYFRFDSSVILPEIAAELAKLKPLINEDRLATIFGHADPVGTIEYNAHLSARRARALFALLTRNADIWVHLFGDRQPYDQWGLASTQIMLGALTGQDGKPYYGGAVDGVFGQQTDRAIRTFQREEHDEDTAAALAVDGVAGPKTRKRLYQRYMDALTGTPGQPLLRPDQFLGDPADNASATGKARAAFQGCSEYNPILIFSDEDEKKYAKQQDKTERNAHNAPNRRAMIFFFSKRRLPPLTPESVAQAWPCPAWDEGPAGCKAKLWPDSDKRLANGDEERRYEEGEETMACSWYDRFARRSPCEGPVRPPPPIASEGDYPFSL
jgi:hypothetical protein